MRFIVLCIYGVFCLGCMYGYAAEARGFLHTDGCGFMEESLHLQKLDDHKLNKPIVLKVPKLGVLGVDDQWFETKGMDCKSTEPCEVVTHARIQVLHVSESWSFRRWQREISGASGNFSVELSDGRKIQGGFKAKLAKQKIIICE